MNSKRSRINKWEDLYTKTNGLTKPNSIDKLLSKDEIKNIENTVIKVLNAFFDKGDLHKGMKVYIDKILRNDFVEIMASKRPQEDESLKEWGDKIFGDNKFGVVFNSLEAYDNTIGELMCNIVAPLIKRAGLPLGGLSFLFFMGNYGFTPFGIHKEATGEEGFLFHLGPGKKEFYTWDNEEMNEVGHNTTVFHEIKDMLPLAKKYTLSPASVMFIPHQIYHIGNTDEFSLSLVMDYINPSKDHLEKELAKEIGAQEMQLNRNKFYLAPIQISDDTNHLEDYVDSESLTKKFRNVLGKRISMLKSNGGLLQRSIVNNKIILPNGNFGIKGKAVFPIYLFDIEEGINILLARGNQIPVKSNRNLKNVLSKINNGEMLMFQSLADYFKPDWDLVDVYSLISDLIRIEAIEIFD
jgi:hypothetical protein